MMSVLEAALGAAEFSKTSVDFGLCDSRTDVRGGYEPVDEDNRWTDCLETLTRFRQLEDDWDGEGSPAPDRTTVDAAVKLWRDLRYSDCEPPQCVSVSVNGTIYFEWNGPWGYLELEVNSPADIEARYVPAGAKEAQAAIVDRAWRMPF